MASKTSAARKRGTNVSLRSDLVEEARELGVSLSQACEQGLAKAVKAEKERRWIEENAEGIRSYNEWVAKNGVPLARYRRF
ncbi:MAG TPA: type II toxin-antitoxin system CcdA family antitoxin [Sphingomicrobium sp.]|nr:type II toxin-antitoxin system CcdA family antitoxin [Sphingomicrobium sp.]